MVTDSPKQPPRDKSAPKSELILIGAIVYFALTGAAMLWGYLADRPQVLWDPAKSTSTLVLYGSAAGLATGIVLVLFTRIVTSKLPWATELSVWLGSVIGPISWLDALFLALVSGFGEEMFFRGAMQPTLGLIPTTIIFALLHMPHKLKYASWTIMAGIVGFWFGLGFIWTGNLAGPIIGHFVINFFNLKYASDLAISAAKRENLRPSSSESSLTDDATSSTLNDNDNDPDSDSDSDLHS